MRKLAIAAFAVSSMAILATAKPVAKVQLPCKSNYQVLSPVGTHLAVLCKDNSVALVKLPGGAQQSVVASDRHVNGYSAAFSSDGRWLGLGFDDGSVEVVSTTDSASTRTWKTGSHRIDLLSFFPDGKTLFVGPVDSPGEVWDINAAPVQRGTIAVEFGGIAAVAVSPDGKVLVAAGDDTVISWYDTATWQKMRDNRDFLLETFALAFAPDGKQVLAGGADARITALDAATAKQVRQLPPEAGSYLASIDFLGDHQYVAAVYLDDFGEKPPHGLIWDIATAKSVAIKPDSPPSCGGVVAGKYWLCSVDDQTLSISQYD